MILILIFVILAFPFSTASASAEAPSMPSLVGADLSWPNCGANSIDYNWGIIGVNGGLDFSPNKCLFKESSLFNSFALYMNTGYPGPAYGAKYATSPNNCKIKDLLCLAYNYGYNAAEYSLRTASLQGVHSNFWWLDVETVNSWTTSSSQNVASLQGMIRAIIKNSLLTGVGFYSNTPQWITITAGWNNQLPNWVATGDSAYSVAQKSCTGENFTNGQTYLSQFTQTFDRNYLCQPSFVSSLKNY